jgi:hypothetical protein
MSAIQYELAVDSWAASDRVLIRSPSLDHVGSFPLPFLRKGGDNTWAYIMGVIGELVDRSSDEVWRIEDENGREMAGAEAPDAGVYTLTRQGGFLSLSVLPVFSRRMTDGTEPYRWTHRSSMVTRTGIFPSQSST